MPLRPLVWETERIIVLFPELGNWEEGAGWKGRSDQFGLIRIWDHLNEMSRTQMDLRGWSSERVPMNVRVSSASRPHSERVAGVTRDLS